MRKLESAIENKFVKNIQTFAGDHGIDLFVGKLNMSGRRGWPDRILFWTGGNVLFIEFKRPGEAPRKLQNYIHDLIENMGFEVRVYDNYFVAMEETKATILSSLNSVAGHQDDGREAGGTDLPKTGPR